jgi:putative sterol carrier protein
MLGIEECARMLETERLRFMEEKNAQHFSGWNKTMQYAFTDSGEHFHFAIADGKPGSLVRGKADNPEIEYRMDTDTFADIASKTLDPMKAFQRGLVKIKASVPDMLKLMKLS